MFLEKKFRTLILNARASFNGFVYVVVHVLQKGERASKFVCVYVRLCARLFTCKGARSRCVCECEYVCVRVCFVVVVVINVVIVVINVVVVVCKQTC